MRKYIEEYLKTIEEKIERHHKFTSAEKKDLHQKILYFSHERLIHLLVTITYCLVILVFLALGLISYIFLIPFFLGIIFLLFYIPHYFFLENAVQYLYKLEDKINFQEL